MHALQTFSRQPSSDAVWLEVAYSSSAIDQIPPWTCLSTLHAVHRKPVQVEMSLTTPGLPLPHLHSFGCLVQPYHQLVRSIYLCLQVQCPDCPYVSRRYEPFVYLSLSPANSIKRALQMYTRSEELSGDNKWRCSAEKTLKDVRLCTSIHQPPNILALHLKRFRTDLMGSGRMSVRKLQHQVCLNSLHKEPPGMAWPSARASLMSDLPAIVLHLPFVSNKVSSKHESDVLVMFSLSDASTYVEHDSRITACSD